MEIRPDHQERMRLLSAILLVSSVILVACKPADTQAEPISSTLWIQGMHCEDCASSIHQSVIVIDGVETCEVSFESGQATITADDPATIGNAAKRIRLMGFTVDETPDS